MILYADTSALMKVVLREDGTTAMLEALREADVVVSAAIAYVEWRAALAAAARQARVTSDAYRRVVNDVERRWANISRVPVDEALIRVAGDLAERAELRGDDAVHLAALLEVGVPDDVVFACWDAGLRRAARNLGYNLVPRSP